MFRIAHWSIFIVAALKYLSDNCNIFCYLCVSLYWLSFHSNWDFSHSCCDEWFFLLKWGHFRYYVRRLSGSYFNMYQFASSDILWQKNGEWVASLLPVRARNPVPWHSLIPEMESFPLLLESHGSSASSSPWAPVYSPGKERKKYIMSAPYMVPLTAWRMILWSLSDGENLVHLPCTRPPVTPTYQGEGGASHYYWLGWKSRFPTKSPLTLQWGSLITMWQGWTSQFPSLPSLTWPQWGGWDVSVHPGVSGSLGFSLCLCWHEYGATVFSLAGAEQLCSESFLSC